MEILSIFLTAVAILLGLPCGFLLANLTKEELKPGKFYFIWMQNILLILVLNIFFYSLGLKIITALFIFLITSFLIIRYEPRAVITYFVFFILFYLSLDTPILLLVLSSLIFLYGFPTAALIKLEGIEALRYPFRHIIKKTLIIGHRGAPDYEPENTLSSFKKAIKLGVDMIETDLRMTKDKKLVLIHDSTVDRTTNGIGYVRELIYKNLRKFKITGNEKIPTLEEAIDLVKGKCQLNIHVYDGKTVEKLANLLKRKKFVNEALVSSSDFKTLARLKELNPKIRRAYLMRRPSALYLNVAKKLEVEAIHPLYRIMTKRLVLRAQKNGFKVNVWTIKDRKSAWKSKLYYEVDGIITNDPLLYAGKDKK